MERLCVEDCSVGYRDTGQGPVVITAHCSSASHKQWLPLSGRLSDRFRLLMPDLIGYGESDGWPAGREFDPYIDVKLLVELARKTTSSVHLVGHSYGGAMALEAARRLGDRLRGLTLIEPVAFHLLRGTDRDSEWNEIHRIARGVVEAVLRGDRNRAANVYMGFWIGRLKWMMAPRKMRRGIVASIEKVAHEFDSLKRVELTLSHYADLGIPTRLLMGSRTKAPARAVVEALAKTLLNAELEIIEGAGHMSPFTHTERVNRSIIEHVEQYRDPF